MAWQTGTTAASSSYRDFLTSIVAAATSQHVSAVAINAAGTGYVVGEILTIPHAGGYITCQLEVTTIGGGGSITGVRIIRAGAYSNRLASAVVSAGGTGYVVGNVLQVLGGSFTEAAKVTVATLSGSAVATVTVFETGGAYTSAPSNPASTSNDPGLGTGTGATLTLTMTGLIGTTGATTTASAAGTGATFDLTLTASGWSAVRNRNNRTENAITNEKEVVLLGTVVGGDAPYVAFTSYTQTSGLETRRGIAHFGMTGFNSALSLAAQPGIGPLAGVLGSTAGSHTPVHEAAREWWLSVTPRKIAGVIRTTNVTVCYCSFYVGFMNGFGTATTSPYPMFIGASTAVANRVPDDSFHTGLSECFRGDSGGSGPMHFRRKGDAAWVSVINGQNAVTPAQQQDNVMFPVCTVREASAVEFQQADNGPYLLTDGKVGSNIRANVTELFRPAPDSGDDFFVLWPLTVLATAASGSQTSNLEVAGELDNVFWFNGVKADGNTVAPEDYFEDATSSKRYRIFPNATQGIAAKPYQFFCMAEE